MPRIDCCRAFAEMIRDLDAAAVPYSQKMFASSILDLRAGMLGGFPGGPTSAAACEEAVQVTAALLQLAELTDRTHRSVHKLATQHDLRMQLAASRIREFAALRECERMWMALPATDEVRAELVRQGNRITSAQHELARQIQGLTIETIGLALAVESLSASLFEGQPFLLATARTCLLQMVGGCTSLLATLAVDESAEVVTLEAAVSARSREIATLLLDSAQLAASSSLARIPREDPPLAPDQLN